MRVGQISCYIGPMFSGKTTKLKGMADEEMHMAKNYFPGKKILVINSIKDKRYGRDCIATHTREKSPALCLGHSYEIFLEYQKLRPVSSVYIDEANFFDSGLVDVVRKMSHEGTDVNLSFLNLTSEGTPFPFSDGKNHVGALLAIADYIERSTAHSLTTGEKGATMTHYKHGLKKDPILVGEKESYEAVTCEEWHLLNRHHIPKIRPPTARLRVARKESRKKTLR